MPAFVVANSVGIPAAPTGLTVTAASTGISLAWNAVANTSYYNIYRSTTTNTEVQIFNGIPGKAFTDTTVIGNTTYFYKVTAVNGAGESARSAEASGSVSLAMLLSNLQFLLDNAGPQQYTTDGAVSLVAASAKPKWNASFKYAVGNTASSAFSFILGKSDRTVLLNQRIIGWKLQCIFSPKNKHW